MSKYWNQEHSDVKFHALPPDEQYLEQGQHQWNKSWYSPLNDHVVIATHSTMSSQYFCSAAVFCYDVSLSEYWH